MNHVKKECVAMLLAGGQGSRLYALTQNMAKPADPYGGKYGIVLFLNPDAELVAKDALASIEIMKKEDPVANAELIKIAQETARNARAGTLKGFLGDIAALGDPIKEHKNEITNSNLKSAKYENYVYVSDKGSVKVSKA